MLVLESRKDPKEITLQYHQLTVEGLLGPYAI